MKPNLENSPAASTEGPGKHPTLDEIFQVSDDEAITALPQPLRNVVRQLSSTYGVEAKPIVAACLAVCGMAVGNLLQVESPTSRFRISVPFNLALCMSGDRSPGWLNFLRAYLFGRISKLQCENQDLPPNVARDNLRSRIQRLEAARKTVDVDPQLIQVEELAIAMEKARLKPAVASIQFEPTVLKRVIEHSFDEAVTLADLGGDPVERFLELKKQDRQELVRLLNCSWDGLPLFMGERTLTAALSVFWPTREEMLVPFFECEAISGSQPPAILLIPGGTEAISASSLKIPDEDAWISLIDRLFFLRCHNSPTQFPVDESAEVRLCDFTREIGTAVGKSVVRRYITWLPELALRLAILFAAIAQQSDDDAPPAAVDSAILITKWLAGAHLQVVRSMADAPGTLSVRGTDNAASTDRKDPAEVMLRKIRQKGPIPYRQLWRSYNKPKAAWFQHTLDSLLQDGRVTKTEAGMLLTTLPGGSAAVVAVPK
jgi:hypothetical protein